MPKKKDNKSTESSAARTMQGVQPGLDPSQRELARFVAQMSECVHDFTQKVSRYEGDEEIYEIDEDVCFCDADDYGSDEYEYPTKAKAKTACMAAIQAAVDDVLTSWGEERDSLIQSVKDYYTGLEEMLVAFIAEFYESYDEYMKLECTGEMKAEVARQKDELFGRQLERQAEVTGKLHDGFEELVDTILNMPATGLRDVRDYFDLCDYDTDDESFCFTMQDAVDAIESDVSKFFAQAVGFPAAVEKSHQGIIGELCDMLLEQLKELRRLNQPPPPDAEAQPETPPEGEKPSQETPPAKP